MYLPFHFYFLRYFSLCLSGANNDDLYCCYPTVLAALWALNKKGFSAGHFYCLFMTFLCGTPAVGFLLSRRAEVFIWLRCKSIFAPTLKCSLESAPEHQEIAPYRSELFKGWCSRWDSLTGEVPGAFKRGKSQGLHSLWLLEQMHSVLVNLPWSLLSHKGLSLAFLFLSHHRLA